MTKPRILSEMRGFLLVLAGMLGSCTPWLSLTTYIGDLETGGVRLDRPLIVLQIATRHDLRRLVSDERLILLHARVSECGTGRVLASGTVRDERGDVTAGGRAATAGRAPNLYLIGFDARGPAYDLLAEPRDICIRLVGYPDIGIRTGAATNTVRLPAAMLAALAGD